MRRFLTLLSIAAALAFGASPALADDAPAKGDDAKPKIELPPMSPDKSIEQSVEVGGRALRYKATVGHIDIRDDKGKVIGQVVYTAYTAPGGRYARPVTFAFNGGPGASSVFLNMGAIGPKHVSFGVQGDSPSDPAVLHDNPNTWLDFTDLVFIDPVGTGFSRSLEDADSTKKDFYDAKTDIQYLSRVVYDWLVKNGRLTSRKYLIGESYGGFRVPKLAYALQSQMGVGVSGIVMVSPYLDPAATGRETALSPLPWMIDLPAMAAGHFEREGDLTPERMAAVENYTRTQFVTDFLAGTEDKAATDRLSAHVAELTGLDPALVRRLNGRVDIETYLREIRRNIGQVGGV
jgi:carboxypeptidase C (cathepsin A)